MGGPTLVVCSAHKTLPAPGQTALLFSSGTYSLDDLRRAGLHLRLLQSFLSHDGGSGPVPGCAGGWGRGGVWDCGGGGSGSAGGAPALRPRPGLALDPCRLVLSVRDGFGVKGALEGQGVYPEMADVGHVVFIATCADGAAEFARLRAALEGLSLPPVPTRSCPGLPVFRRWWSAPGRPVRAPAVPPSAADGGGGLRGAGGPLSPRRAGHRPRGAYRKKTPFLFDGNRI